MVNGGIRPLRPPSDAGAVTAIRPGDAPIDVSRTGRRGRGRAESGVDGSVARVALTDPVDVRLLAALAEVGKTAVHELAAKVGLDPREVAYRLVALSGSGLPLLVGVESDPAGLRTAIAGAAESWRQAPPSGGVPVAASGWAGQGFPGTAPASGPIPQAQSGRPGPMPGHPGQTRPAGPAPGGQQSQRTGGAGAGFAAGSAPQLSPGTGQAGPVPSGQQLPWGAAPAGASTWSGAAPSTAGPVTPGGTGQPMPGAPGVHNGPSGPLTTTAGPNALPSGPYGTPAPYPGQVPLDPALSTWGVPQTASWARGDEGPRGRPADGKHGRIGETLPAEGLDGEQLAIQLLEVHDPADFLFGAAGYRLEEGERAVVVHTEITNRGPVPFAALPDNYLELVTADGGTVGKAPVALTSRPPHRIGVRPGETLGGHTVYVLPEATRVVAVRWSPRPEPDERSLTWTVDG